MLHAMATQTERSPLATARRAADVGCGSHHTIISAQWLIKSLEHGSNTPPRAVRDWWSLVLAMALFHVCRFLVARALCDSFCKQTTRVCTDAPKFSFGTCSAG